MHYLGPPLLASIIASASVFGQSPVTYPGKLDRQLVVDTVHIYQRVWSAVVPTSKLKFTPAPEKGALISTGELIDQRVAAGKSTILLVEPLGGTPYLWFDSNENAVYEATEKVIMDSPVDKPDIVTVILRLPIKNAYFSTFPIFVHYMRGFKHPDLAPTDRLIAQSVYAVANGRVQINGSSRLFQYPFDPQQASISTTEGLFGVDVDGDGKIKSEQFSREISYAAQDELVFPLGDLFVSTSGIDIAKGDIVVRQRSKQEYQRIDLEVGMNMPDFAFIDTAGKQRRLSDFRGKYVMVDFWGVWCADCIRETPYHLAAYQRYRNRGLEILGLNTDERIETLLAYLDKHRIPWPQAVNDSIKDLANRSYRLHEYPTTILLDPTGKVLVLNQQLLRGDALLQTLDRTLPK